MPESGPLPVFRFWVDFRQEALNPGDDSNGGELSVCGGGFSDCTGLEATMEPKVIKEGGRNYGPAQRAGQVTFATVVLKRGMTSVRDLWKWWDMVTNAGGYSYRLTATITMFDISGAAVLAWELEKAMPVKFKAADLNAKGTDVGIEELHLAHEGLKLAESMTRTTL